MTLVYVAIIVLALGVVILAHWLLDKLCGTNDEIDTLRDCLKDENGALDRKIDRVDFSLGKHVELFAEFNEVINDRIDKINQKAGILEDRVQKLEEAKKEGAEELNSLKVELFILNNPLKSNMKFTNEKNQEFLIAAKKGTIIIKTSTPERNEEIPTNEFYSRWFNREYVQIP